MIMNIIPITESLMRTPIEPAAVKNIIITIAASIAALTQAILQLKLLLIQKS